MPQWRDHMTQRLVMDNPMVEGTVWKQLLRFFFPILLGTFFQQLYNTADALIVGRILGENALGAVGGSTGMITSAAVGFFMGLTSGAAIIAALRDGKSVPYTGIVRNYEQSIQYSVAF